MPPALGLILTHTQSIHELRAALSLMRASCLKVVSTHGLAGGWTAATIAEAARLCPLIVVRTRTGDPSYGDGRYAIPDPQQAVAELAPWVAAAPDRVVAELGNEPTSPAPGQDAPDLDAYARGLDATITVCRQRFPSTRLIAPAHSLNDPRQDAEVARWLARCGAAYRRADGVALHAYSADQARRGFGLVRQEIGAVPLWLTEVNLGEALAPAERGRRIWALVRELPVAAALIYHLDQSELPPSEVQGPALYRLGPETLASLGLRDDGPAPTLAERPPVISLAMTRERLSRGRLLGPPRVLVIHATGGSSPGDLAWLRQGGGEPPLSPVSCHYYIDKGGRITQLVADYDTAWHCGDAAWTVDGGRAAGSYQGVSRLNWLSLGVELENRNTGADPYPEAQLSAAAALARHLVAAYAIPRGQLVRHRDISPGRKTDPAGLDWAAFVARVFPPEAWAAWGVAFPLPTAQRGFAIPRRWLAEAAAGRPLGAATSAEQALGPARAARAFVGGVIVWMGGERTEVLR